MKGSKIEFSVFFSLNKFVMLEYANLIRKMWLSSENQSVISPVSFKNTIGRFAPRFTGYLYVEYDC